MATCTVRLAGSFEASVLKRFGVLAINGGVINASRFTEQKGERLATIELEFTTCHS